MHRHFIILGGAYSIGSRIALHFIADDDKTSNEVHKIVKKLVEKYGNAISTHSVYSEDKTWKSLVKADMYFDDVNVIEDVNEFMNLLEKNLTLTSADIANYILSVRKCTHLELEKLVYLCYAEYLCKYNKKLFEDKIYAFRYGPVCQKVFNKYKDKGSEKLKCKEELKLALKSRIYNSEDGLKKAKVVDYILEKYKDCTARDLVNITHKKDSPWDKVYDASNFNEIPDELIVRYHKNEIE